MKRLILDESLCKKQGLTICEALLLCIYGGEQDLHSLQKSLSDKGLITPSLFGEDYTYTHLGEETISKLKENSPIKDDFDYESCAVEMRALFPKGNKIINGSTYPWKCNKIDVIKALQWFRGRYNHDDGTLYTKEDILDATRRYIESFNGIYENSMMRTIRNFIKLQCVEKDDAGIGHNTYKSDLASWIETDHVNEGQEYNGRIIYG